MKRLKLTGQRVIAAALVVIALALVWQTVRQELSWWGSAGWFGYAPLVGDETGIEVESVVEDLWTVNGQGRDPVGIDLAAGLWTAELIGLREQTEDLSVSLNARQRAVSWTGGQAIIHVGPGHEDARLGIPAGPVELSVDMDGPWAVVLEPVPCP